MGNRQRVEKPKRAADMILRRMNLAPVNSTEVNSESYSSFDNKMKIHLVQGIILTILFALSVYKATKDKVTTSLIATCFVISIFTVVFVICEMILRLCQVLVLYHWSGEDLTSILSRHLIPNITLLVISVCAVLLFLGQIIISRKCPLYYVWDFGPHVCVLSMIFSFLLLRSATYEWKTNESPVFSLSNLKGLDYGTGMAYSYYYGYLRLVLPSPGTISKGIVEKIGNFEDKHDITFPVHRLFILIPSSGYIPTDLREASDQWMENVQGLEEERRNRAGNIGRTYRNNVYKIYPNGQNSGASPVYIVAEGASPLLTFYEVQKHNHAESAIYKQFRHEIISTFHMKLYNALQSEFDTKDLCELIYYDDYEPDGTKVNIAKIILERISQMTQTA